MFQLKDTIVSEELIAKDFTCNLSKCKGLCCIEGDSGAPLEEDELPVLEGIYEKIKPFLRQEGIDAIESQGAHVVDQDGDHTTPLVQGEECAYLVFGDDQMALCGIEQAYKQGIVDWKKPVSCHLYPIRIQKYSTLTAVNYHKWTICDDACSLGEALKTPVYRFAKEALIRRFGESWYADLDRIAETHNP